MCTLKVGVIGLGVGGKHIQAFQSHNRCEVISLCDFSEEKLSAVAGKAPQATLTKDAADILEDPTIDAVSIASFEDYHYEQIVKAIRNGKHVFVEKPICLYRHEAVEIRKLLKDNPEIQLSSNLNLRTCPRFIRLKEAVQSGEMGRLFCMEGDYLWGRSRIHRLVNGWRTDMEFYSIIYGGAVHLIDLLMWIAGMKPVEVQGFGNRIAVEGSAFRYNDFTTILLRFPSGMTAKVSASGGCVHPHFHRVLVYGTEKTFIHDISGGKLLEFRESEGEMPKISGKYPDYKEKGEIIISEVSWGYPGVQEKAKVITSFVDSILDSRVEPVVPCEDVFASMAVCFAAEEAVQKGTTVQIEYI